MRVVCAALLLVVVARAERAEEVAWNIYRMGSGEQPTDLRFLVAELNSEHPGLRDLAADALIRLKAKLPPKLLRNSPIYMRQRRLILMALNPDEPSLLAQLDEGRLTQQGWTLVCNLLAKRKTVGLAARLLARTEITLHVAVFDPRSGGGFMRGAGLGGWASAARIAVEPGWPPRAYYALTENKGGATLIADGRRPVYYRRTEVRKGTERIGISGPRGQKNDRRFEYLADLLGRPIPIGPRSGLRVEWTTADAYRAAVIRRRAEIAAAYRKTSAALLEAKLLTKARAAGLKPRIKVEVHDKRESRKPVLPELPGG